MLAREVESANKKYIFKYSVNIDESNNIGTPLNEVGNIFRIQIPNVIPK